MTASTMNSSHRRGLQRQPGALSIPEDDVVAPSPTTGMRKAVQFPESRPKLEATRRVSRLSARGWDEIVAMWGDEDEDAERKERIQRDLMRLAEGEESDEFNLNGSGLCSLGLKDKIGDRADKKIHLREAAWDAVMWNQHDQWEEQNNCDYEEVAKVYTEGARTSEVQEEAQEEAKKLAEEIEEEISHEPEVLALLRQSSLASQASSPSCVRPAMRGGSVRSSISSMDSLIQRASLVSLSSMEALPSERQIQFQE